MLAPYTWRAVLALLILSAFAPTPPRLIAEPPQTVQTLHPIVCIHTRLTDEVEAWKIQRTLQLVREMGAPTIVEFLPWAYVESNEGRYDWQHPDRIINLARDQGLTVIARLGLVPGWARSQMPGVLTSLNSLTPAHYADYARFVGAFAARYRDRVSIIIPWNEPNLSFEWGYRQVPPAEYVGFLAGVYRAAHAASPDVMIVGGALAPNLEPPGSTNAINDLDYLEGIYAAGGGAYFDALSIHAYDLTKSPPETAPARDQLNFRRTDLLLAIMAAHGDARKPVYITEAGWNDHPRWNYAVRPGQRIAYTLDAYRYAERNWPTVRTLCPWLFRTPAAVHGYPDYWAFVTPDFQLRPIYDAVRGYARETSTTTNALYLP